MIKSLFQYGVLLALVILGLGFNQAYAQTAPADLGFTCGGVNLSSGAVSCDLQVPADIIGTELEITIPTDQLDEVSNLQEGETLPGTSAFFKLDLSESNGVAVLVIEYADFNAEAFTNSPYALVSIDLVVSDTDPDQFPKTINALLQPGSQLFTPSSLAQNQASYAATEEVILPIILNLDGATTGAAPTGDIESSFSFEGENGAAPTAPQDKYCFDDPISSMTDAEWAIVCDAKSRGIVSGNPRPDGIFFFPNQAINRAEAVKIVTLGVLRSLGKLTDEDFAQEQRLIEEAYPEARFITYIDILYEANGVPPWFAVYVNIATDYLIVHGYREDNTYRAINKIVNAESYRIIVEAGRVASQQIGDALQEATNDTIRQEWFMKYAETLRRFSVDFSEEYAKFTTRKDFLIIVMNLLAAVGL